MLYLTILLFFVFFAGLAMTVNEGLWSNTVSLFAIILAGTIAVVGGVPLGRFIMEQADADPDYTWHLTFAGVWLTFVLSITIIRLMFDRASRTRVKFVPPLDKIAGPLMGLYVAVMFTSFAAFTLVHIPITAGEWKMSDAADWQKSTFEYARAPFWNIINRVADSEEAEMPVATSK